MDFMGMGPFEILLVLIVGFLFLGPEKLPSMAARAGEWYRKLTKATSNLAKSLTEEISTEAKASSDLTKSITDFAKGITGEIKAASDLPNSLGKEISTEIKETGKTLSAPSDEKASK